MSYGYYDKVILTLYFVLQVAKTGAREGAEKGYEAEAKVTLFKSMTQLQSITLKCS